MIKPMASSSQINILVPLTSADLGGSQLFLLKLIDAMPDMFQFSVLIFEDGPMVSELKDRGIACSILPRSMLRTPWGLWQLRRKLQTIRPDVIYLHASRIIALLARQLGIPCVERINMSRKPEIGGWCNRLPWLDRLMTEWNTRVIAVSDSIRQQLITRGVSDSKIIVIRNFVDVERFYRPELHTPARRELGISEDAIVVLNVGRMVPQKGQADFIEAAALCLPNDKRIHFLLVGDGPLKEDLTAQAERLNLDKTGRFQILPFQKDIERLYAASDILLHTAHWDPLANVLLEAMAARLYIIATGVDGTQEALEGYQASSVVVAGNISGMVKCVLSQQQEYQRTVGDCWKKDFSINRFSHLFLGLCGKDR